MLSQARILDLNGNPVIDATTGQFQRGDAIAQAIYIAVKTTLGSAGANTDLGVQWPRKMGDRFDAELRNSILAGLRQMIDLRVITVESVSYTLIKPEIFSVEIRYYDNTTRESRLVTV